MNKTVRTPTRAEGGITPKEAEQMAAHSQTWIGYAFRTTPIEPDKIVPAIEGLYEVAGLKKPRVVIVPSPMVMVFAYGAASIILEKNLTAPTQIARVETDTVEQAAARACYQLAGKDGLERAQRWYEAYQGGNMWAGYECYLTAARDILGLRLPEYEKYKYWEQAAIHGGFRVMHPEFCIVSDFPEVIKVDNQNRPHGENGPSHRWRDGWALYHWHGVKIPAEWIEEKDKLTAKTALTWENVEQRRAACEILGWDKILVELNAKTIDKDPDPEVGELLEVMLEGSKERFIRVQCGTGRKFALPVPPNMKTALQANAWTFGIDNVKEFIVPERT